MPKQTKLTRRFAPIEEYDETIHIYVEDVAKAAGMNSKTFVRNILRGSKTPFWRDSHKLCNFMRTHDADRILGAMALVRKGNGTPIDKLREMLRHPVSPSVPMPPAPAPVQNTTPKAPIKPATTVVINSATLIELINSGVAISLEVK